MTQSTHNHNLGADSDSMQTKNLQLPSLSKSLFVFLAFAFFFSILPLATAIPPVQTSPELNYVQIAYPQYEFIQQSSPLRIKLRVYNETQYLFNDSVSCYTHIYNGSGFSTTSNLMNFNTGGIGKEFFIDIAPGNFSQLGQHSFIYECNSTGQTGFVNGVFEVTQNGQNRSPTTFIIVSLVTLVLLVLSIFFDDDILRFFTGISMSSLGILTFIYGFNGLTNLYTQVAAAIVTALGGLLLLSPLLNIGSDSSSNDSEEDDFEEE